MSTYTGPKSDHKRTLSRAEKNARKIARADRRAAKAERARRATEVPDGYQLVRVRVSPSLERANRLRYGQKRWWILDTDAPNPDTDTGTGVFADVEAIIGRKAWLWQSLDVTLPMRTGAVYCIGSGATVRVSVEITPDTEEITIDPERERAAVREASAAEPGSDLDETPAPSPWAAAATLATSPMAPPVAVWLPLLAALDGDGSKVLACLQHSAVNGVHPNVSAGELFGVWPSPLATIAPSPSDPVPF